MPLVLTNASVFFLFNTDVYLVDALLVAVFAMLVNLQTSEPRLSEFINRILDDDSNKNNNNNDSKY